MRRSQIFDLLSSFRKLVVNIFILRNLIVGWGRELLRRGIVLCIRSIDLEEVLIARGSRIHQNKSWYYLESFKNSKVELGAKIVIGYYLSIFLSKVPT